MAVLQMQRISICALKKNRKEILEILQRRGIVELCDLTPQDSVFSKADTASQRAQFEKDAAAAVQALAVLDEYVPVKSSMLSSLEGRQALTVQEYEAMTARVSKSSETARRLNALAKKSAENKAEILKLEAQLDALAPWLTLDVPMRFKGTRSTTAYIGALPGEVSLETVYAKLAELAPNATVSVDPICQTIDMTGIFVLTPNACAPDVDAALRAIGFAYPASPCAEPPREHQTAIQAQIEEARAAIDSAKAEIEGLASERNELRFAVDYNAMRSEKYGALSGILQSRRAFFISGYIPKSHAAALEAELTSRFDAAVEFAEPAEDEDVPVALKNNGFAAPLEGVLESYSLPGKGEIDPTSIMSLFYYFLFGLMLSDFGYGAILAIATGVILVKFKNMEPGMRRNMQMFFYCGISTAIWGIIFSSYFGDIVTVVSATFFGKAIVIPPAWFVPLDDPMRLLVFCMGVGVIHLFTGLGIQLYQHLKAKRYKEALFKVGFWYMLVGGLIVYGLSTDLLVSILQLKASVPAGIGSVFSWIAAVGAIGIVLTGGDSKNIGIRFAQGLYELYNVTGYLSDILSYSRLLALGLATGVIGSVINQMGSMMGGGIIGAIAFLAIALFGHSINFGIELLGAYVHTNRLQYVEFFGKFYEGGGRKFNPFGVHTKYYKFKEDIHNG